MNYTTYQVAVPNWAISTLITWDYDNMHRNDDLTRDQAQDLNDWLRRINPHMLGFVLHDPEEHDQPNVPMIPAFGDICDCTLCYFTIYHK